MEPVEGALPSISSKGIGWGWGREYRWCRTRMDGSRKESEAPESTRAWMEMSEKWKSEKKGKARFANKVLGRLRREAPQL